MTDEMNSTVGNAFGGPAANDEERLKRLIACAEYAISIAMQLQDQNNRHRAVKQMAHAVNAVAHHCLASDGVSTPPAIFVVPDVAKEPKE